MNDDLISREALKKSMRKSINERYISWTKTITVADIATLIFDEIEYAPTVLHDNYSEGYQDGVRKVLSERPTGHWCKTGQSFVNPSKFRNYCCSNCLCELDEHIRTEPNFCPNCGADMKKETDNDE